MARAERFELPSTVLETAILPLNYARILNTKSHSSESITKEWVSCVCNFVNYSRISVT